MKKTKILATFGPAVASPSKISQLIRAGVNLFRINCSHGTTEDFLGAVNVIREGAGKSNNFPVGLLFDISGPKLRLERFRGELPVKTGQKLTLTTGKTDFKKRLLGVNNPAIIKSVKKDQKLYIDDGSLMFDVISVQSGRVTIKARNSGLLLPGKGINLPDTDLKIPAVSAKDTEDIKTAVRADADYLAMSFVRSAKDILQVKQIVKRFGGRQKVIAKLEKREAVESLDAIMDVADGVMVARGDLGVELPPAEVPRLQKKITRLAYQHRKPVIVATQMLESMRSSPRATRAEVNDVASAVFDFVDAVMLSAETAIGKYPLEAVQTMSEVINTTEQAAVRPDIEMGTHLKSSAIPNAIAEAVIRAEQYCDTKVIFAFTTSGFTAELISNLFPPQPVIALTPNEKVMTQLSLYRSVYPVLIKQPKSFSDMLATVNSVSRQFKLARRGDRVVITGGAPFGSTVSTNFLMIHEVGR
jgi:pyruvate kinase